MKPPAISTAFEASYNWIAETQVNLKFNLHSNHLLAEVRCYTSPPPHLNADIL